MSRGRRGNGKSPAKQTDNVSMDKKEPENPPDEIFALKTRLKEKLKDEAVPMDKVPYTKENYKKLFPNRKVRTPLGDVALRKDQYDKLARKDRKALLGGMRQTLTDPIIIIGRGKKKLFIKSFNGLRVLMAVAQNSKGELEAISTHIRPINNSLNKIQKKSDILYEKNVGSTSGVDEKASTRQAGVIQM
jgi:hypothetical protein